MTDSYLTLAELAQARGAEGQYLERTLERLDADLRVFRGRLALGRSEPETRRAPAGAAAIAWLAGILEGEGHFGIDDKRYGSITLTMTDRDVVERAAQLFRRRVLSVKRTATHGKHGPLKPQWVVAINGHKAAPWLMTVYALMGARRRARIRQLLDLWRARRLCKNRLHYIPKRGKSGRCHLCLQETNKRKTRVRTERRRAQRGYDHRRRWPAPDSGQSRLFP